jgi:putative ABC transport system permease protein
MLRVALRGLLARKLRTALTTVAVVLGVAFVAATFVFTDTINASFKDLFQRASKGVDVSVKAHQPVEQEDVSDARTVPASVLAKVQGTPGVAEAAGRIDSQVAAFTVAGKQLGGNGPPMLLESTAPSRFDPYEYKSGGPPEGPDELALNQATADRQHLEVGDRLRIVGRGPAKAYRISGLATLGDVANLGGAGFVVMTLGEAQRVDGLPGQFTEVVAAADGGTTPAELKARLRAGLQGGGLEIRTGKEEADQQAKDIGENLSFLTTALLVFAGVALLVGGFLIFNTFSVTVAQRTREFALLRTLGASRPQILRSVVAETVLIGLLASVVGVLAGLALAPGLRAMMAAFGLDLPNTGTVVAARTIIAGFAIGIVATVVSGFIPARRATRVEPVEAMRESVTPGPGKLRRRRLVAAVALGALGVALLLLGLFGPSDAGAAASLMGGGAVLMMFGVALLAPLLVRPLAALIGRPLQRLGGLPGRLARENAERQPQRTAVTASALMVGLALVVFVTIFAAGIKASVTKVVDEQVRAGVVVQNKDGFSPIPVGAAGRLARVPGVEATSALTFSSSKVRGVKGNLSATGVDPATVTRTLALKWKRGSDAVLRGLTDRQAVLESGWAKDHRYRVGSTLSVLTPLGRRVPYRVVATFENKLGLTGDLIVTNASVRSSWGVRDDAVVLAATRPGADDDTIATAAKRALRAFPVAEALTVQQFKDDQAKQVDQILGLFYALLSLSVIVALLGIVNTLALSVHERTRELGMLRAVGMSRRQVRRMIRGEAVITALIGAILGLVLGAVFAALVSRPLADEGFTLSFPVVTLVVLAILAGIAGVLAAIPPARRAARVDILRAVTAE